MSIEGPMNKTLCFMLSGKAGVGKSFSAQKILDICSKKNIGITKKFSFAGSLKEIAYLLGWGGKKDRKSRKFLQKLGETARDYDGYVWARLMMDSVDSDSNYPFDVIVVDDWRFPNELEFIQKFCPMYKAVTVRIEAPDREIITDEDLKMDSSETSLDDFEKFNYLIDNNSLNDEQLTSVLSDILEKEISKNTGI